MTYQHKLNLIFESKCPYCGVYGTQVGINYVQCNNPMCKFYKPVSNDSITKELRKYKPTDSVIIAIDPKYGDGFYITKGQPSEEEISAIKQRLPKAKLHVTTINYLLTNINLDKFYRLPVIQKIKIPKPETSPTSGYAQPIQTDLSQRQPDISSSIA